MTDTLRSETIQDYDGRPSGLLIADAEDLTRAAHTALESAGIRVIRRVGLAEAVTELHGSVHFDLLILEARDAMPGMLEQILPLVERAGSSNGTGVVVAITEDQIDLVAGYLLGPEVQLLCDATLSDRISAIGRAGRVGTRLSDQSSDAARLHELIEEAARLAESLRGLVDGRLLGTRSPAAPGTYQRADLASAEVRLLIRARRQRDQHFPPCLFADPAWDMLLDLYAAHLEGQLVSVSSLCVAAAVPATTGLRWISIMEDKGLFERTSDENDRRRIFIHLTPEALATMRQYFASLGIAGLLPL